MNLRVNIILAIVVLARVGFALPVVEVVAEPGVEHGRRGYVFDVGLVWQGEQQFVRHSFAVRNTGTHVLQIKNVTAGCACTAVDFDTLVEPGQQTMLLQEVNLHGFRSGPFFRSIQVFTDARNRPRIELGIAGVLRTGVEIDKPKLAVQPDSASTFMVRTRMPSLRIEDVYFEPYAQRSAPWRPRLPIWPQVEVTSPEQVDEDGYYVYAIAVDGAPLARTKTQGVFKVKTNHPRMVETGVSGTLVAR